MVCFTWYFAWLPNFKNFGFTTLYLYHFKMTFPLFIWQFILFLTLLFLLLLFEVKRKVLLYLLRKWFVSLNNIIMINIWFTLPQTYWAKTNTALYLCPGFCSRFTNATWTWPTFSASCNGIHGQSVPESALYAPQELHCPLLLAYWR